MCGNTTHGKSEAEEMNGTQYANIHLPLLETFNSPHTDFSDISINNTFKPEIRCVSIDPKKGKYDLTPHHKGM